MKTFAAVLESIKLPLNLIELEIPPLKKGQVLVQMSFSGICRSQINELKGYKGEDKYLPHTLGHEGSGVVLETGEGVEKVKKGDHVVVSWIKGKGLNAEPIYYLDKNSRKINSGPVSTFLTKAVISENRLFKIPKDFSLKEATLLGCAFPTGAGVVINQMKIKEDNSLAIIGVGGIGSSALITAKLVGANPIIAIDIRDDKLQKALSFGATHVINSKKNNVNEYVSNITQGRGVDFALECAGITEAMEIAFSIIHENNGLCVIAGNVSKGKMISIDPFDLIKGKTIIGSWGGGSYLDEDIPKFVELCKSDKISLKNLISNEINLEEINGLIDNFDIEVLGRSIICFVQEKL